MNTSLLFLLMAWTLIHPEVPRRLRHLMAFGLLVAAVVLILKEI